MSFAKYAVAFFKISFSMRNLAFSSRKAFKSSEDGTGESAWGNSPDLHNALTQSRIDQAATQN
jgi:hypothetical protein